MTVNDPDRLIDDDSSCTSKLVAKSSKFAGDCVCYREIKDTEDTVKRQEDIDHLGCWARKWVL